MPLTRFDPSAHVPLYLMHELYCYTKWRCAEFPLGGLRIESLPTRGEYETYYRCRYGGNAVGLNRS